MKLFASQLEIPTAPALAPAAQVTVHRKTWWRIEGKEGFLFLSGVVLLWQLTGGRWTLALSLSRSRTARV